MNFKTTIVLIVLLAIAAGWLLLTREHTSDSTASPASASLISLTPADVTKVVVSSAEGAGFTLEKSGADWRLTAPVLAPAESFEVDSLIRAFTDAKPTGSVDASSSSGLNPPRQTVELDTAGKNLKLNVGDRSTVGDSLYVQVEGDAKVQLVPAAELSDRLAKGADAYRKMSLVTTSADQIQQISIQPVGAARLLLAKSGGTWQMLEPLQEPVDDSAASDLTFALAGLRADSFVEASTLPPADTARPQLTVSFSTQAATTAPSTQPVFTTVNFDAYEDIAKKSVYVTVAGSDAVAKVAATTLDSFKKTPLDLRDKRVADFAPDAVKRLVVTGGTASSGVTNVTLEKRHHDVTLGPTLPTSGPATLPTSVPASASKWTVIAPSAGDADDAKVATLIAALHPLRADKFVAAPLASTQPAAQYTITITTTGAFGANTADHVLQLTDQGSSQPLRGEYDGVTFETARSLLTDLQGTWAKKP